MPGFLPVKANFSAFTGFVDKERKMKTALKKCNYLIISF